MYLLNLNKIFNTIVIIAYLILIVLSYLTAHHPAVILAFLLLSFAPLIFAKNWPILKDNLFILCVIITIAFIPIQIAKGSFGFGALFTIAGSFFALYIIRTEFYLKWVGLCTYAILGWLLYSIIPIPIKDLNDFFPGTSRNGFSTIVIQIALTYYLLCYKTDKTVPLLPAALAFAVSLFAIGRSGIICSFLILIAVLYVKYYVKIKSLWFKVFMLITVIGCVSLYYVQITELEQLSYLMSDGVESGPRSQMLNDYIQRIDLLTFFTGYNYSQIPIIATYGLNPHNSFIRLHYHYGFVFFIVIWSIILALIKYAKKKNILFCVFFISLLLRSFTDVVLFVGQADFLFYSYLFYAFYCDKKDIVTYNHKIANGNN